MAFRTKPRGEQLSFLTECHRCRAELSITNGRVGHHDCQPIEPQDGMSLDDIKFQ